MTIRITRMRTNFTNKVTSSNRFVIPAKAGIQCFQKSLDAGLRRELSRTIKSGMTEYVLISGE